MCMKNGLWKVLDLILFPLHFLLFLISLPPAMLWRACKVVHIVIVNILNLCIVSSEILFPLHFLLFLISLSPAMLWRACKVVHIVIVNILNLCIVSSELWPIYNSIFNGNSQNLVVES
jgi:hypothetical protein